MPDYVVVKMDYFTNKRAAKVHATDVDGQVYVVAKWDEQCSKGADHTHARYDGATFCQSCGRYLSVKIDKRL